MRPLSYVIIYICLLANVSVIAQERFYNIYDGWKINKVIVRENDYLTCGSILHPVEGYTIPQFNITDLNGNVEDSFYYGEYFDGITVYRSGSYLYSDDTLFFVAAGVNYYKENDIYRLMMKYYVPDKEMDTIIDYDYCEEGRSINYLIDKVECGFAITSIYTYSENNCFPFLYFVDETGDTLSTHRYDFLPVEPNNHQVIPYQLLKLQDGGFIMSCQDEFGISPPMPKTVGAYFIRIDSEGNELWRQKTSTVDTLCFRPFIFPLQGTGNYLITWIDPYLAEFEDHPYYPNNNDNKTLWFADMDDSGNISNRRKVTEYLPEFPHTYIITNDHYQDEDGNIYLTGYFEKNTTKGFLLKINPEGEALWYREYICFPENEAEVSFTKIYGITPTPDGGFVMGGEYISSVSSMFPEGTQQGLVIKVDSCGCLEEGCNVDCGTSVGVQTINSSQLEIFPNPATDQINIQLPVDAEITLYHVYDIAGKLVIENKGLVNDKHTIKIECLNAGIYTINLWASGKMYVGKFVKE